MTWWALEVTSTPADRADVAAWLVHRTGQAVEEREDGTLVARPADSEEAGRLRGELVVRFGAGARGEPRQCQDVDWTRKWRDGLHAMRIGRLVVLPSWLPVPPDALAVVVDPEGAFGSGAHGSTRAALALMERHLQPGDRVLDFGTGSGILAIAAVRLGASRAIGLDTDPDAVPIAEANAERNGVEDRIAILCGDAGLLAPLGGPADLIVSNILRLVNTDLLPVVGTLLSPGGRAIFAGMEASERGLFLGPLEAAGFSLFDEVTDDGWWAGGAAAR